MWVDGYGYVLQRGLVQTRMVLKRFTFFLVFFELFFHFFQVDCFTCGQSVKYIISPILKSIRCNAKCCFQTSGASRGTVYVF